ncbi:FAD-dependent monooxygenase [Acidithiobacillus ferrianus]|uniref:FAD-dependent monooxygenase n=1 Tax=Acidithiobacillus ferrianus TaxID=2678518 RepID=UPI0034E4A73B
MRTLSADLAILGDGPVARSLVLALADSPLHVVMLDTSPLGQSRPSQADRTVALALGSRRLLCRLGLTMPLTGAAAIQIVQITQQGISGQVRLEHSLLNAPERRLGEVAGLETLNEALALSLARCSRLQQESPGPLQTLQWFPDRVQLDWPDLRVETALVVVADGGHGGLARLAALQRMGWDHNRHAVIATVTPRQPLPGVAFEHFLESGPLAFLPIGNHQFSIVWSLRPGDASRILDHSDAAFLEALNRQRPPHLPPLTLTGPRSVHPLFFQRLWAEPNQRLALVGNAAQTLHPLAGQGYNLGLRDAVTLAALLREAAARGNDPGEASLLRDYARIRRRDRLETIVFTETMNRLFSSPRLPLRLMRATALTLLDQIPFGKRELAARLAGVHLPAQSAIPDFSMDEHHVF